MTWLTRLIIGLILATAGSYFYQKYVLDEVIFAMEESDSYDSDYDPDDDDDNDDDGHYAYDEYDTGDDW